MKHLTCFQLTTDTYFNTSDGIMKDCIGAIAKKRQSSDLRTQVLQLFRTTTSFALVPPATVRWTSRGPNGNPRPTGLLPRADATLPDQPPPSQSSARTWTNHRGIPGWAELNYFPGRQAQLETCSKTSCLQILSSNLCLPSLTFACPRLPTLAHAGPGL